ncbi:MAG: 1-phosphofructokinase family hexose kinase [Bryobacteraceae bacterium]
MIVTLTINPAVDRTVSVDKLVFEDRAYILARSEAAGGRGLNASRVLASFGAETVAVLAAGGEVGERIGELLEDGDFPSKIVKIAAPSRINLTISDKQGLTAKLNELGPTITPDELKQLHRVVEAQLAKATWLMICGSVPPGVDPRFYQELVRLAHARGVKTLIDTDGDALQFAMEAKPTVIAPNQAEAERLLHTALLTRAHYLEAARRLKSMGPENVVLSLGGRGAIGVSESELIEVLPPRVDALCPIGAGDALAAAFVWAVEKKKTFPEAVRWGVAAGTASAVLPGIAFASLKDTQNFYRRVEVRSVAGD